jgi:hypothetical protein
VASANALAPRMKEQKPQREWRRVPRLLPATGPPSPVAMVEVTLELMTARLADLVNARVGTYRLDLCLCSALPVCCA